MLSNSTGQQITATDYPAEYLHREEIMCPLPQPTHTFEKDTVVYAYIYDISVSNDGEVFSNSIRVISYKMDCTECTSKSCNLKVGKQELFVCWINKLYKLWGSGPEQLS